MNNHPNKLPIQLKQIKEPKSNETKQHPFHRTIYIIQIIEIGLEFRNYLENDSVEDEPYCREEQCKERKKDEIFVPRVGFLLEIDVTNHFDQTHFNFWAFGRSERIKRGFRDPRDGTRRKKKIREDLPTFHPLLC